MSHWVKIDPSGTLTEWDMLELVDGTIWDEQLGVTEWDLTLVQQDNWEKQLEQH